MSIKEWFACLTDCLTRRPLHSHPSCAQHTLCTTHPVHNTPCTQHSLCTTHHVHNTPCAQHTMYTTHPVHNTPCAQHTMYIGYKSIHWNQPQLQTQAVLTVLWRHCTKWQMMPAAPFWLNKITLITLLSHGFSTPPRRQQMANGSHLRQPSPCLHSSVYLEDRSSSLSRSSHLTKNIFFYK